MLITFEGIDGCGKSTQAKLLSDYLLNQGYKSIILREPGGTKVSEAIRNILLGADNNINPITELLLFEAARSEITDKVIIDKLQNNYFVICDRYYDSTTAYQGFGRKLPLDDIKKLNQLSTRGIKPDITFFLDIPLEIAQKRIHRENHDRMELSGIVFFEEVIKGYKFIAEAESDRVVVINAMGNIEDTHHIIMSYLKKFL